eukprot:TRINITY_DN15964_c0_g1_i1.p1 TRINITY_DN15964_c0_g1~~TRINITY_DN15964_c0_g1_i1.p1  ORF type:complete len:395 (+),score=78.89 TRINITY_DN15964_c0_g1_i1:29-1186(+)
MTEFVLPDNTISYITDVEGDLELWHRSIEISKILKRGEDGALELLDGMQFVFGGDVIDHGPGDLRILDDLLALKQRYPDRVHFIIGNRDINKLRIPFELSADHIEAWPLSKHPGVYWLPEEKRPSNVLEAKDVAENCPISRLRWILQHTLGAPKAFESRREELSRKAGGAAIDDAEVMQSFVNYAQPGGAIFEYLKLAELAVLIGDVLIVHAGLPRSGETWCPGWVPGIPPQEGVPLRKWVAALQDFKASALQEILNPSSSPRSPSPDFEAWSMKGGYDHSQPGSSMLQYMMRDMPDGSRQPSIVYNGWLGDDYQPLVPDKPLLEWLEEGGIRHVLSGHLPHGDSPLVRRLSEGISAISADISYAKEVGWATSLDEMANGWCSQS